MYSLPTVSSAAASQPLSLSPCPLFLWLTPPRRSVRIWIDTVEIVVTVHTCPLG